jgi:endogenous inhibitor of DNA gyrase (YacG/DUF329 family)
MKCPMCGKESNPKIYCKHGKLFLEFCSDNCCYAYMHKVFSESKHTVLSARLEE